MTLPATITRKRPNFVFRDEEGFVFAYLAVALVALLGLVALGVDFGAAYFIRTRAQVTADAAALAGRAALSQNTHVGNSGRGTAGANGFDDIASDISVQINCCSHSTCDQRPISSPPASALLCGDDPTLVQAIVTRTVPTHLAKFFGIRSVNVQASATAALPAPQPVCILGLGFGANVSSSTACTTGTAICGNGNVSFGSPSCGVASNSGNTGTSGGNCSAGAADFRGGSASSEGSFYSCGNYLNSSNSMSFTEAPRVNAGAPVVDPYVATGGRGWVMGLNARSVTVSRATTTLATFMSDYVNDKGANTLTKISNFNLNSVSQSPASGNPPDAPLTSGTKNYDEATGGTLTINSNADFNINQLKGTSSINLSNNQATVDIGTMSSGTVTVTSGTLSIFNLSGGTIIANGGTVNISSLSAGSTALVTVNAGATISVATMAGGSINGVGSATGAATTLINTLSGGTLTGNANAIFNIFLVTGTSSGTFRSNSAASYNIATVGAAGTTTIVNGSGNFTIGSVTSGSTVDGVNSGQFYIGSVGGGATLNNSGGASGNSVFYINNIIGSLTTNYATLVLFSTPQSLNGSNTFNFNTNSTNSYTNLAPNTGVSAYNAGITITSPNAITLNAGGSGVFNFAGALYLPASGSVVDLSGSSTTCGQIIASQVRMSGNVSVDTTGASCNLTSLVQRPGLPVLRE